MDLAIVAEYLELSVASDEHGYRLCFENLVPRVILSDHCTRVDI